MLSREIQHKTGAKEYFCYTKEEATERGIDFVPWPEATDGCWVLSTNNMVAQCITTKIYTTKKKNRSNKYVKTAFGSSYYKPKTGAGKLILSSTKSPHNVSGSNNLHGTRKELGRLLALNYALTSDLKWSIGKLTTYNEKAKKFNWYKFSKTQEFKQMVREELNKLLAEKGFTEAETLDLLNDTIKKAKSKNDTKTLASIVAMLFKMHGIDQPTRVRETNELSATGIENLLDNVTKEEMEIEYHGKKQQITEGYRED
jgi:hypothetical protein